VNPEARLFTDFGKTIPNWRTEAGRNGLIKAAFPKTENCPFPREVTAIGRENVM
jgi:hypothetical protein